MAEVSFLVLLSWSLLLVSAIIQIPILVAVYTIIKHYSNCPAYGCRISNEDRICDFCGTERLTKDPNPAILNGAAYSMVLCFFELSQSPLA